MIKLLFFPMRHPVYYCDFGTPENFRYVSFMMSCTYLYIPVLVFHKLSNDINFRFNVVLLWNMAKTTGLQFSNDLLLSHIGKQSIIAIFQLLEKTVFPHFYIIVLQNNIAQKMEIPHYNRKKEIFSLQRNIFSICMITPVATH